MRILTLIALIALATCSAALGSVSFGPADPLSFDQPRVAVEIYTPDPEYSYGPEYANVFLLDTGAQGLIVAGYAVTELENAGYQTESTFYELGVGGYKLYDVSAVYNLDFAGTDGQRITLEDVRILSSGSSNFGGFGGIIGTPGMVNRVTSLDMTHMLGDDDGWGLGIDYMGVAFGDAVPAPTQPRYSVDVELVDFPPPLAEPDDPMLPTYGPLPMIGARLRDGDHRGGGDFVLDTGGQISLISTQLALDLGLDANGDGSIADDAIGTTELSGASGTITAPIVAVEQFVLPTREGVDLIWTDLELVVLDLDPSITGIFGADLLTTGWMRAVLDVGGHGALDAVHFDFSDPASGAGLMVLDVNAQYDQLVETTPVPGDADEDGAVNLADFVALKNSFGVEPAAWFDGDFNADRRVGLADFVILKNHFGSTTVPEPTVAALMAVGAAAGIRRRR